MAPLPTLKADALLARQAEIHAELRDLWGNVTNDRASDNQGGDGETPCIPLEPPVPPKRKKGQAVSLTELPPVPPKTDVHWDFLCKEMQWLATDFCAERKRHATQRRRLAHSVSQHFSRQAARAEAALVQAQAKRRKRESLFTWQQMSLFSIDCLSYMFLSPLFPTVASKLTRDVRAWWTKLEKVITYRQKVVYDKSRQQAMNRQLVTLVKQTERYTESLAHHNTGGASTSSSNRRTLTIEQALATTTRTRKVHNYARLAQQQSEHLSATSEDDDASMIYGVSLLGASEEDSSFAPSSDESDDETTLREAEQAEFGTSSTTSTFKANPVELLKLQQEQDMDITKILERLQQEGEAEAHAATQDEQPRRKVQFADDPGADADDDGDASDVEDYQLDDGDDENDGEFEPQAVVDDETTLAAEEAMPQEMTREQELQMLQDEQEISVEELRQRYAAALRGEEPPEEEESPEEDDDENGIVVDDEDFEPIKGGDVDDETTIAAEEKMGRDMSYEDEISMLRREGEMSVEELRAMYAGMGEDDNEDDGMEIDEEEQDEGDQKPKARSSSNLLLGVPQEEESDQDEFVPVTGADVDDETTIEAEERLGRDISYEDEIALLKRENDMSVEELRAMYAGIDAQPAAANEVASEPVTKSGASEESKGPESHGRRRSRRKRKAQSVPVGEEPDEAESSQKKPRTEHTEASDTEAALAALEASAEKARTTLASRPFLLSEWVKLREYQQVGLNWLVSLHSRRLNGILADEMGLGKTLQTITLLAYLAAYKGIWGPHLVVVPTSVILNWETELKRFCPSFKVLCYYGSAKRRKELRTGWTKTNVYHVVITSYQLAVQDAFAFKRKRWYYLIVRCW